MSHSFPQIYSSTVIHHHSSYILLLLFLLLLLSLSLLLSLLPRSFISATSVVTPLSQFLFSSPGVPLIALLLGCAYCLKPQNSAMLINSSVVAPVVLFIQSPLNSSYLSLHFALYSAMFIAPYRTITPLYLSYEVLPSCHISAPHYLFFIKSSLYKIYSNPPNFSVFFLRLKLVLLSAATSTNSILICGIWHQFHEKMEGHDASTYYPRSQHKTQQRSQNKIQYFTPESSLIPQLCEC